MGSGSLTSRTVLLIGTADTKAQELLFIKDRIVAAGANAIIMDVGILGTPSLGAEIPNSRVATAAGTTLEAIVSLRDENEAMTIMASGAVRIARELHATGTVHGVLAIGGTMGTDLALEVTAALPVGLPKLIVSTIAYSPLIPPDRLAPDLMMVLWSGGLHGLNSHCKAILSQAAGAIVGACGSMASPAPRRPLIAVSSLGQSSLSYMLSLIPALEARGFEPVVFHCIGMGGRALEWLAAEGRFVAVFDLALQELANEAHGSVASSGAHRMETAGALGIPQICAPGGTGMIDLQSWRPVPSRYADRAYHSHNRLLSSVPMSRAERRATARLIAAKLAHSRGPTALLLPLKGLQAADRPGEWLYDPAGLAIFFDELRRNLPPSVELVELDCHINDPQFVVAALAVFDRWSSQGRVPLRIGNAET